MTLLRLHSSSKDSPFSLNNWWNSLRILSAQWPLIFFNKASPPTLYKPTLFYSNLFANLFACLQKKQGYNFTKFSPIVSSHCYIKKVGVFFLPWNFVVVKGWFSCVLNMIKIFSFYLFVLPHKVDTIIQYFLLPEE